MKSGENDPAGAGEVEVQIFREPEELGGQVAGSEAPRPPTRRELRDAARDPEGDAAREEAFGRVNFFREEELRPFSISRAGMFERVRQAMGAAPVWETIKDTHEFLADACRLVWLCSHEPADWNAARGDMERLQSIIDAWADEEIGVEHAMEASAVAAVIYADHLKSRHVVAAPRGKGGDDLGN